MGTPIYDWSVGAYKTRTAIAKNIERTASRDGYSISVAIDATQSNAWRGLFAVFRGENLIYADRSPYGVRAWLHVNT